MKYRVGLILLVFLAFVACKKDQKIPTSSSSIFYFESFDSGCKDGFGKIVKMSGNGTVVFSSFNDTIRVLHANAKYNCCSEIQTEVKKTNYGFDLFQKEVGETCRCMCYHDLTVFICNVSVGTYLVKVFDIKGNLIDQGYVVIRPSESHGPRG
jgi:hypothetical protein